MNRVAKWVIVSGLALLVLGAVGFWAYRPGNPPLSGPGTPSPSARINWDRPDDRPLDPRLSYRGPFQNIHPDVQYVGSAKCAECHDDIAQTYAKHPMARSVM